MTQPPTQVVSSSSAGVRRGVTVPNINTHTSDVPLIKNNAPPPTTPSPQTTCSLLLNVAQHSDAIRCQNKLPLCPSDIIQTFLSFQDCCCRSLSLGKEDEKKKATEKRGTHSRGAVSSYQPHSVFGQFCRLSPTINSTIKGFAVKVILTVGLTSPLSLLISHALINFQQLHAKDSFFFLPSKSRNYSCLLNSLSHPGVTHLLFSF